MEIKTVAGRGKGVRFDDDAEMYLMGRYLNASTGKVVNTEAGPPFEQVRGHLCSSLASQLLSLRFL